MKLDADALDALSAERARALAQARAHVPALPGLYAIHGPAETWVELGLGEPPDRRPLYIGKSESNLITRDLEDHFGDGRTGWSTVRRSFAALLHDQLELEGQPRNPARPERPANYGLSPCHDRDLTKWMLGHLMLAVWPRPAELLEELGAIEGRLLTVMLPPLNLSGVRTPWTTQVKAARKIMANEARLRF